MHRPKEETTKRRDPKAGNCRKYNKAQGSETHCLKLTIEIENVRYWKSQYNLNLSEYKADIDLPNETLVHNGIFPTWPQGK